jgi:pantoate--beta-alanine ligase
MASLLVWKTPAEVRAWTAALARDGRRLALVPTMGFLHEGHLSLMREGARRADVVAASIFVNPTQFGPKEDLSRYPRDAAGDLEKCASAGVAGVYMPEPAAVYPPGYQTYVTVEEVSRGLCGDRRPGHFRGVATVVTKLLALFRPHVALFGEKDYQQLQVISRLNDDLELGVEIVGMPTVREADGLAMSSRNAYLSAEERARALSLSRGLFAARDAAARGEASTATLLELLRRPIADAGLREDYVAVCDAATLQPLEQLERGRPARALVAAFAGATRLIDNVALHLGAR